MNKKCHFFVFHLLHIPCSLTSSCSLSHSITYVIQSHHNNNNMNLKLTPQGVSVAGVYHSFSVSLMYITQHPLFYLSICEHVKSTVCKLVVLRVCNKNACGAIRKTGHSVTARGVEEDKEGEKYGLGRTAAPSTW